MSCCLASRQINSFYKHSILSWLFGIAGCKLLTFITLLNLYGSVFFLVGMGFDRFLAVVYAVQMQRYRTHRNAVIACSVVWILALLVASQSLFLRKVTFTSYDFYLIEKKLFLWKQ